MNEQRHGLLTVGAILLQGGDHGAVRRLTPQDFLPGLPREAFRAILTLRQRGPVEEEGVGALVARRLRLSRDKAIDKLTTAMIDASRRGGTACLPRHKSSSTSPIS